MKEVANHTVAMNASPAAIWHKLVDFSTWPSWDTGMKSVHFDAPLKNGSRGKITPKGGSEVDLIVTEFSEGKSYTDEFPLWGGRFIFEHYITSENNQNKLNVVVKLDGGVPEFLAFLIGPQFKTNLPIWMNNFKRQIEAE